MIMFGIKFSITMSTEYRHLEATVWLFLLFALTEIYLRMIGIVYT